MTALDRLLHRIGDPHDVSKPHPMLTLEEYFTGNVDRESLGPYARTRFSPQDFFSVFFEQRAACGFHDIRVEILPELTPAGWPRADTIWLVTDFDRHELPRQLTENFWNGFLPVDWLSYPRMDGIATELLTVPNEAFVSGFDYSQ